MNTTRQPEASLCKGDLLDQTRVIYEKLGVVLEAAGMSFDNVVQTVDYIDPAALPQYRDTGAIRREFLGGTPVGATGIWRGAAAAPGRIA